MSLCPDRKSICNGSLAPQPKTFIRRENSTRAAVRITTSCHRVTLTCYLSLVWLRHRRPRRPLLYVTICGYSRVMAPARANFRTAFPGVSVANINIERVKLRKHVSPYLVPMSFALRGDILDPTRETDDALQSLETTRPGRSLRISEEEDEKCH